PVLADSGRGNTFLFPGGTPLHLGNPSHWPRVSSASGGIQPGYLGSDTASIRTAAVNHTLNLPCCPSPFAPLRKAPPAKDKEAPAPDNWLLKPDDPGVRVFPNPAGDVVYIDIP